MTTAVDTAGKAASVFPVCKDGSLVAFTDAVMDVNAAVIVSGRVVEALDVSGLVELGRPVCMACGFLGRCVVDNRPEAEPVVPCVAVCALMPCAVRASM